MRLKNVPGSREGIEASVYVIKNPEKQKGKWASVFGNLHPIRIEVGMGKGKFITALARENPQINYIGIEKYSSVLIRAVEKMEQEELHNLRLIRMDAVEVCEVFGKNEVDQIYLNFSDPWPKDRHAKRRLTSPQFFQRYDTFLKPDGQVEFKTDNERLFDYSLESIPECGWIIREFTRDLHHHPGMMEGNVMTEYEEKFSSKGNPICKLTAYREKNS